MDRRLGWLFWSGVWLAIGLVAIKAFYLGLPGQPVRTAGQFYLRALAALSYTDVAFVAIAWAVARLALVLVARRMTAPQVVAGAFTAFAAFCCLYAVASVVMFSVFGGFLTYPLLALVGDVRMLQSSAGSYLTRGVVAGLVCVPLTYVALVWASARRPAAAARHLRIFAGGLAAAWLLVGWNAYYPRWTTRQERAIAENPEWVFASSWWRAVRGGTVQMADRIDPADLTDFEPLGARASVEEKTSAPLNVIVIVLESVAARWTSLHSRVYDNTTPSLVAESAHGLVADNFYAHIGRSSNSLVSILLSLYPRLDFREITDVYPHLPGTSLATVFQQRGYRTSFTTPSDLSWANWTTFLDGRGFGEISDYRALPCTPLTSWGVEDRCMFDGILSFIAREPARPFFIMGWTQQTHHPYEPAPSVPLLELVREPVEDRYELNRYLNVLRETDRHLGRLFESIRGAGLDQRTMVVVVGDHGQAFGYPHEGSYTQGRTIYEEDVHVPLIIWHPRRYETGVRSNAIGGLVDLAPTIAEFAGLPPAADWQGRSLIDGRHFPRAYFYVAEDHFRLGVRQDRWKYIYDLREGVEELYDLERDPDEQNNVAASEPQLSARLRQRLAAWAEANRRQYVK